MGGSFSCYIDPIILTAGCILGLASRKTFPHHVTRLIQLFFLPLRGTDPSRTSSEAATPTPRGPQSQEGRYHETIPSLAVTPASMRRGNRGSVT